MSAAASASDSHYEPGRRALPRQRHHLDVAGDWPPARRAGSGRPLPPEVYRRRRLTVGGALVALLVVGLFAAQQLRRDAPAASASGGVGAQPSAPAPQPAGVMEPVVEEPVLEEIEPVACMLSVPEVRRGSTGPDAECAQRALRAAGAVDLEVTGTFDQQSANAASAFQAEVGLYVDGIVGRNTATELGIWPGAEAFIVRTPPPAPGATDLLGMPLSSVASAGADAPELPEGHDQVSGKRVVYDRTSQRVWAIDDRERIVRSYLVSGSKYRNEVPGVHTVYSKSEMALGWDMTADLPYMVRYTETERGNIGFHAIPSWRESGEFLQTEEELGQKLSGGCTRQALLDAKFMWEFADVGTKVIVL